MRACEKTDKHWEGLFSISKLFGYYLKHKVKRVLRMFVFNFKTCRKSIYSYIRANNFDSVPNKLLTTAWAAICSLDHWFLLLLHEHLTIFFMYG